MSEDSGEKKYAASQKKLQDQRKKGQVAQSQDIGKLLVLAVKLPCSWPRTAWSNSGNC